jgi:hypothetical protein
MKVTEAVLGGGGSAGITLLVYTFTARVFGIGSHRFVFGDLNSKSASS